VPENAPVSPVGNEKETAASNPAAKVLPAIKPKAVASTGAPARAGEMVSRPRKSRSKKRFRKAHRFAHRSPGKRNHADAIATPAASFLQTVSKQQRLNYYSALQNGEAENFFGQVLTTPNPTTQQLSLTNIETTAEGPAQLQIALQGIGSTATYSVFFNDVMVGTIGLFYREHPVASFSIPVASLREGNNDIKFVPNAGSGISFVDYVRLSYPRSYRAENNSLRFTTRFNQTVKVDGFTSTNVRVLDISDPLSISEVRPIVEPSASGYALTIPAVGTPTKGRRTLLAFLDGEFQQPASVALNTPSNLNAAPTSSSFRTRTSWPVLPLWLRREWGRDCQWPQWTSKMFTMNSVMAGTTLTLCGLSFRERAATGSRSRAT
jgi:hypothetical protein